MKPVQPMIVILLVIVTALVAGFGGWQIGRMQSRNGRGTFTQQNFGGRGSAQNPQNMRLAGGRVTGQIVSADGKSLTVKLMDGGSKIILLSDQTMISKAAQATAEDLQSGTLVAVFGTTNPDGSVTAQSVQINPTAPSSPMPAK